ncbi:hypothetical protein AB0F91_33745 [Amycolatopsis sp. NPDC023774]|uniref:hypothetical protein n=1 Tax=Amycolatopsis sp. NPDC023774 TaxID=3155015 RepID=UPI0033E8D782
MNRRDLGSGFEGRDAEKNRHDADTAQRPSAHRRGGRAELGAGSEPDLRIDGLLCSDQPTAHALTHAALVRPVREVARGQWVPAELTPAGTRALDLNSAA